MPTPGPVAVISQSGAYGQQLAYLAGRRGLGVSYCITTGNEADVTISDALQWVIKQSGSEVVLLYAEGVRDGAAFVDALRAAELDSFRIVLVKVGRSSKGAHAVSSHTAALAGSDGIFDA